jgi:hypothetical protein
MAPVLQVDDEFVENVTLEGADALLERLRRGEGVEGLGSLWNVGGNGADSSTHAPGAGAQRKKAK